MTNRSEGNRESDSESNGVKWRKRERANEHAKRVPSVYPAQLSMPSMQLAESEQATTAVRSCAPPLEVRTRGASFGGAHEGRIHQSSIHYVYECAVRCKRTQARARAGERARTHTQTDTERERQAAGQTDKRQHAPLPPCPSSSPSSPQHAPAPPRRSRPRFHHPLSFSWHSSLSSASLASPPSNAAPPLPPRPPPPPPPPPHPPPHHPHHPTRRCQTAAEWQQPWYCEPGGASQGRPRPSASSARTAERAAPDDVGRGH